MQHLMLLLVTLILWLPTVALWGWALEKTWTWFMVPVGLPALAMNQLIGVALVVSFMCKPTDMSDTDKLENGIKQLVAGLLRPLFAVGAGWVYLKIFW